MSTFTLRYKGLNCFGETDEFSGSDEIYLITVVSTIENGRVVSREVQHPVGLGVYENVNKGASFSGPLASCYSGVAQDLSLLVILMERDEGDPNTFRDKVAGVVGLAALALEANGIPVSRIAEELITDIANAVIGSGDDLIAQVGRSLTQFQVVDEARRARQQEQNVSFTFFTDHRGGGATYKVYFDIEEQRGPIPTGVIDTKFEFVRGDAKVAANPQDKFVVAMGDRLIVTTQGSRVFGHEISFVPPATTVIVPAIQFTGTKPADETPDEPGLGIGFNPEDKFVLAMDNRLVLIRQDGLVFGADVDLSGRAIGRSFLFGGPRVARNPEDKFALMMGNRIIVIRGDGHVFGHEVNGRDIGPGFQFSGASVAANPQDKFVVAMGDRIIVIRGDGRVFGHEVNGRDIGPGFPFGGANVAADPQGKFVVAMRNRIVVITEDGRVFGHEVR